jgi:hypothetical protein
MLFVGVSCDYEPEFVPPPEPEPLIALVPGSFDASNAGRITGRVTWTGHKPVPPPFLFGVPAADGNFTMKMISNPNTPVIDDMSCAVTGAVVFLRGIDPSRAKPWDHPPVRVELKDRNIRVIQGDAAGRAGFVRRGGTVEMKSAEPVYHVLRARGAAFFSLTFPQPDQPLSRTFDTAGCVELSSGSGFYWASADLFVSDQPYWAQTDSKGHYDFENVPTGSYEVVAWIPGWDVTKQERDPETGLVTRQTYSAPLEASRSVKLDAKKTAITHLSLSK